MEAAKSKTGKLNQVRTALRYINRWLNQQGISSVGLKQTKKLSLFCELKLKESPPTKRDTNKWLLDMKQCLDILRGSKK